MKLVYCLSILGFHGFIFSIYDKYTLPAGADYIEGVANQNQMLRDKLMKYILPRRL